MDALGRDAGGGQVVAALGTGHEQQLAQLVGQAPVDLLGHRVVEGAQPGLDVCHRHAQLDRDERSGQRRVDVAVDDDERRLELLEGALEGDEEGRGLAGLAARADAEVEVRRRAVCRSVKNTSDIAVVVVLAGVDEPLLDTDRRQRGR